MTDSLGKVRRVGIESVGLTHGEPGLQFRPLILTHSSRTIYGSFVPQEAISYDIPIQRVFLEQLILLEQHDQLAFQGNR